MAVKLAEVRVRLRRARGESGEQVAERSGFRIAVLRMAVLDVDETAEPIDVLDRVLQRCLPADKQRRGQREMRQAEKHVQCWCFIPQYLPMPAPLQSLRSCSRHAFSPLPASRHLAAAS